MHKQIKIISAIIALIVIVLLVFSVINYRVLHKTASEKVSSYVGRYGLLAVFLFIFVLEVSPQPFISGLAPLASGLAFGIPDYSILTIAVISVIISGFAAYSFGWVYGDNVTSKLVGKKNYDKYVKLAKKHGNSALAIVAFSPIPYFPVLAGAFKIDIKNFFIFGVFFRIIHYLVFGYLLSVVL